MLDLARKTLQRVAGKEPKSTPADKVSDDMASLSISENNAPASTAVGVAQTATATLSSDAIAAINDDQPNEYPARADLRSQIYRPLPAVSLPVDQPNPESMSICTEVLESLFKGLSAGDAAAVKESFYPDQSYWRDQLALTYHFRTFTDRDVITQALVDRTSTNKLDKLTVLPGTARLTPAGPTLVWIDCFFAFETSNPATSCCGMVQLLPPKADDQEGKWKIWTLATWLQEFKGLEADEARLKQASVKDNIEQDADVNVDVFIVGAGNAGLCLAARLKAYGIKYIAVDKAENIGDNWALRYDNMRFHVTKPFADTPCLSYPEDAPKFLHRDDLAAQCRRLASTFDLNVWTKTTVKSTTQDATTKQWNIVLQTPHGERVVHAKQLVQATGVGSRFPYVPKLDNEKTVYEGVSIHSQDFKNGNLLKERGVKSVIIVGSANTAFDVLEACHEAGLKTTMVQRSPTYLFPVENMDNPNGLGVYNLLPADIADSVAMAGPIAVGGQLMSGLHQMVAAGNPTRYDKLREAGFQVDSNGDLMNNLLERAGGHYIDMGQTALIADGKVGIKSGVSPKAFTAAGLSFSDGSELAADAIIWCTGYADKNVRTLSPSILGTGGDDLASRMDATWQLDAEGELRGLWKRQLNIENFWITGGFSTHHRYYSRLLAVQLKAAVEGKLPPAYRDTPKAI